MEKRAQVTIFIIIGLILLSFAVFVYIAYNVANKGLNSFTNDPLSSEKMNPIKEQMSLCLENKLKKGITLFGLSKPDLDKYINENMDECIQFSSFEEQGFAFDRRNSPLIETTTSENTVYLDVEPRVTATLSTNKSKIPNFSIKVIMNKIEDVSIDENGIVQETISINSSDNNAQLLIPKGTKITGSSNTINIAIKNNEQISYLYFLFPVVYDFGPDGATFDPPVLLTISYDPALLSPGQNMNDLKISSYDTSTKTWIPLDTEIDKVNYVLKAYISHFSEHTVTNSSTTPPSKDFRVFTHNPVKAYFSVFFDNRTKDIIYTGTYADDIQSPETYFSHITTFDTSHEQTSDCVEFNAESVFRIRKFKDSLYITLEHGNKDGKDSGPVDKGAIWKFENDEWVWKHSTNGEVYGWGPVICLDLVANSDNLFAACAGALEVTSDGNSWKSYTPPDGSKIFRMAELNGKLYIGANTKNCDWGCGGKGLLLIFEDGKFTKEVPPDNDLSDWSLHGITAFKGKIYVATVSKENKAYIYSYNPIDDLFTQVYKVEGKGVTHWMGNDGNYIYAGVGSGEGTGRGEEPVSSAYLFRSLDGINWEKVAEFPGGFVIDGTVDSNGYMYIAGGQFWGEGYIWWNGPTTGEDGGCSAEKECTARWTGSKGWESPIVTQGGNEKCGHYAEGCDCTSCGLGNYCGEYSNGQTTKWCSKDNALSCSDILDITCHVNCTNKGGSSGRGGGGNCNSGQAYKIQFKDGTRIYTDSLDVTIDMKYSVGNTGPLFANFNEKNVGYGSGTRKLIIGANSVDLFQDNGHCDSCVISQCGGVYATLTTKEGANKILTSKANSEGQSALNSYIVSEYSEGYVSTIPNGCGNCCYNTYKSIFTVSDATAEDCSNSGSACGDEICDKKLETCSSCPKDCGSISCSKTGCPDFMNYYTPNPPCCQPYTGDYQDICLGGGNGGDGDRR